jgi:hypothetical protein
VLGELAPLVSQLRNHASESGQWRQRDALLRDPSIANEIVELERLGLVAPQRTADGFMYDGLDSQIIDILVTIRSLGLQHIFPASLLGPLAEAVRVLIASEIDIFRRRVLEAGQTLPMPLNDVVRHSLAFGDQIVMLLRTKLLAPMLREQSAQGI